MKSILVACVALSLLAVPASASWCGTPWNPCVGPSGPPGEQGEQGIQGEQGTPGINGQSITYNDLFKYISYGIEAKTGTTTWIRWIIVRPYEPLIDKLAEYFATQQQINELENRVAYLEKVCN